MILENLFLKFIGNRHSLTKGHIPGSHPISGLMGLLCLSSLSGEKGLGRKGEAVGDGLLIGHSEGQSAPLMSVAIEPSPASMAISRYQAEERKLRGERNRMRNTSATITSLLGAPREAASFT